MWYNYARFSSVFDFGSAYQLTVADVSKYAVTPVLFLPAIYHYFLQLPDFKTEFPFFHLSASAYKGGTITTDISAILGLDITVRTNEIPAKKKSAHFAAVFFFS